MGVIFAMAKRIKRCANCHVMHVKEDLVESLTKNVKTRVRHVMQILQLMLIFAMAKRIKRCANCHVMHAKEDLVESLTKNAKTRVRHVMQTLIMESHVMT